MIPPKKIDLIGKNKVESPVVTADYFTGLIAISRDLNLTKNPDVTVFPKKTKIATVMTVPDFPGDMPASAVAPRNSQRASSLLAIVNRPRQLSVAGKRYWH
jgi:hypothetical protein